MVYLLLSVLFFGTSSVLWYFYSLRLDTYLVFLIFASITMLLGVMILFYYFYLKKDKEVKKLKNQIEIWSDTTYHINAAGDMAFQMLPIGILIYDKNFTIKWFNDYAQSCLKKSLKDVNIVDINEGLKRFILNNDDSFILKLNDKTYEFNAKRENRILYFFDITKETELQVKYNNNILAIGVIIVDNLEESLKRYDLQEKTTISGQIFGEIAKWAASYNCFFETLDDDRILVVSTREELNKMIENKFDILEKIRALSKASRLKTTISIGIASYDSFPVKVGELAVNAVELAEKRGGDQAVVNLEDNKVQFIGGQVNAVEKNTLVSVRSETNAIKDLTEKSDKVLIMAHDRADCDALGAMIGMYEIITSFKATAKIALSYDRLDITAKKAYDLLIKDDPSFESNILDEERALNYLTDNTLLIVCDTQSPNLVMFRSVLDAATHLVIIDHHRISDTHFAHYDTALIETSASSTVELIATMLMFISEAKLTKVEATIMLAGVVVDTNYFTYRTNNHTFEAVSVLKEYEAEMVEVKKFLRDTYDAERIISEAILNTEIVLNSFAIAVIEDKTYEDRTILAKISDRLLTIAGVEASFTIAKVGDNEIGISARSLDTVNVQAIMEEMGGGGHSQAAANQIKDKTVAEVKEWLIVILKRDYEDLKGEEKMKVILLRDVKGKGKKDDVIEVNNGYGNFLINNNDAILSTEQNLKKLEENKKQEEIEKEQRRQLLLTLKQEIENKTVTIYIKQGADGKLFGHVTTKQIVEEFEAQNGIKLDKRKLELPADINAIGIYQGVINLDKDIQANFQINVVGQ